MAGSSGNQQGNVLGLTDTSGGALNFGPSASLLTALNSWQSLKSQLDTKLAPSQENIVDYGLTINNLMELGIPKSGCLPTEADEMQCDGNDPLREQMEHRCSMMSSLGSLSSTRSSNRSSYMDPPQDDRELQSWELSLNHREHSYAISQSFVSPAALEQEMQSRSLSFGDDHSASSFVPAPGVGHHYAERRTSQLFDGMGRQVDDMQSVNVDPSRDTRDFMSRISMSSQCSMTTCTTVRRARQRRRNAIVGPLMFGFGGLEDMEEESDFGF